MPRERLVHQLDTVEPSTIATVGVIGILGQLRTPFLPSCGTCAILNRTEAPWLRTILLSVYPSVRCES